LLLVGAHAGIEFCAAAVSEITSPTRDLHYGLALSHLGGPDVNERE
jgi:hypothetical protein